MNIKKVVTVLSSAVLLSPIIGTGLTGNKTVTAEASSELAFTDEESLSEELIKKADLYITVENDRYTLSSKANDILTEEEFETINSTLEVTNAILNEIRAENNVVQSDNSFLIESDVSIQSAGSINLEFTWWGAQLQFSHAAVNAFASYAPGINIGGRLTRAQFAVFLAMYGVTVPSTLLASIGLMSGIMANAMTMIDNGNGVNLNMILYVPATFTAR